MLENDALDIFNLASTFYSLYMCSWYNVLKKQYLFFLGKKLAR